MKLFFIIFLFFLSMINTTSMFGQINDNNKKNIKNKKINKSIDDKWQKGFDIHFGLEAFTGYRLGIRLFPYQNISLKLEYGTTLFNAFFGQPVDFFQKFIIGTEYYSFDNVNFSLSVIYNNDMNLSNQNEIILEFPSMSWFSDNKGFFLMFSCGISFVVWRNSYPNIFNFAGPKLEFGLGYKFDI